MRTENRTSVRTYRLGGRRRREGEKRAKNEKRARDVDKAMCNRMSGCVFEYFTLDGAGAGLAKTLY